ncbi:MAG: hypothetical protein K2Q22_03855, partial [Cytophagales bacterium]|nr:hypothetical protein [Cytophagales bacterium]
MNIIHLSGVETSSGLPVHKLSAKYRLTDLNMSASNLKASIGSSTIGNQLVFNYSEIYYLSDFLDSVSMDLNLKNTQISTNDLAQFAPELAKMNQKWTISGIFKGKVGDFTVKDLNLKFGNSSTIKGKLDFKGLPDFYNTFMEMDLNKSNIYAPDLRPFLDNNSFEFVKKLGKVAINGSFIGFPKDFVYSGSFASEIGYLETDLNLKIKGIEKTFYEGKVKAKNFNLGKLIDQEGIVKTVDMDGQINGVGLNLATLKLKAEAQIHRIQLLGYAYKNAKLDASLAKNYFSGELTVKDTNLRMNVSGYADASVKPEKIRLQVNLEHANLQALHISKDELSLSAKGDMNFTGLIQSETEGFLQFSDISLANAKGKARLNKLDILSEMNSGLREIKINSDWVSADLKGDFLIKTLAKEALVFIDETKIAFKNDSTAFSPYHPNQTTAQEQSIEFDISLKNINPVLQLFYPDYSVADQSHLKGSFVSGAKYHFDAQAFSLGLGYKDKLASKDSIDIWIEKNSRVPEAIAKVRISSKELKLNPSVTLEEAYGHIDWNGDKIDFTTGTKQKSTDNKIDLAGFLTLFDTRTDLKFTDSDINILDKHWAISDSNNISFTPNSIIFHTLSFFESQQRIRLNGVLNNNPLEPLQIHIDNFNLATLNSLIRYQLKGTLNGRVTIKDLYQNISIDNQLQCDSLNINNFLFGNLSASSSYDNFLQKIILNADLERDGNNIVSLAGHYDPKDAVSPINLNAKLNKANISVIEPFISDVLSELQGEASGILDVDGSFEKPLITGEVDIDNGKMKVNYLNTTYSFSDKFYFTKDFFGFKNCRITDPNNQKGLLDGGIYHTYFNNMRLGISGKVYQFQVLNTQEKDNDIFYGTGIVTGSFALTGP